jgi:hypothetical protein
MVVYPVGELCPQSVPERVYSLCIPPGHQTPDRSSRVINTTICLLPSVVNF